MDNQTASGRHEYSYTYDYVGNRTTMLLIDGSGTKTHVYSYDNIYQLKDVNYPAGYDYPATDTTFNYDAAGSGAIGDNQQTWLQTTVTGPGTLRFWWKVSCESNDSFAFYVDGQYIFGRSGSADWQEYPHTISTTGPHTLKWRHFKNASGSGGSDCAWVDYVRWSGSVPDPNGWQTIAYTYDPAGRRIEKKYDGWVVVKYLYDGDHCLAEYDGNNNLLRKYIFGPGIDEPISMIDVEHSNATYYYHFDALGSVIALTNSSGSTVELYEYSVYGQVAASDANIPNRFLFAGREFDADTGLYYYRARYYNPEIGRFLQTDPIGYDDGTNWYAYCGNNGVGCTDPSGLSMYVWGEGRLWRLSGDWDLGGMSYRWGRSISAMSGFSGRNGNYLIVMNASNSGDLSSGKYGQATEISGVTDPYSYLGEGYTETNPAAAAAYRSGMGHRRSRSRFLIPLHARRTRPSMLRARR